MYAAIMGVLISAVGITTVGATASVMPPRVVPIRAGVTPSPSEFLGRHVKIIPLKTQESSSSEASTEEAMEPETVCEAVTEAVAVLRDAQMRVMPIDQANERIYEEMDRVSQAVINEHCMIEAQSMSSSSEAMVEHEASIDNDCERFMLGTARYTQCVIAEMQGQPDRDW